MKNDLVIFSLRKGKLMMNRNIVDTLIDRATITRANQGAFGEPTVQLYVDPKLLIELTVRQCLSVCENFGECGNGYEISEELQSIFGVNIE